MVRLPHDGGMQLRPDDLSTMLDAVIGGRLARETAEAWAQRRVDELDEGQLVFIPAAEEHRLLTAVEILLRVGERDEAGQFVHSLESLARFRLQAGL